LPLRSALLRGIEPRAAGRDADRRRKIASPRPRHGSRCRCATGSTPLV